MSPRPSHLSHEAKRINLYNQAKPPNDIAELRDRKLHLLILAGRCFEVCGLNSTRPSLKSHRVQGGAVAQSVERATPGEEVPDSMPVVAALSLLVGAVSL